MKKLMCLKTGKLHEVADSTDWGDWFIEVEEIETTHGIFLATGGIQSEEHRKMVEVAAEFQVRFFDSGCSCHINPPCSYCTHPGNPIALEEAGYDKDGNPLMQKPDNEQQPEKIECASFYSEWPCGTSSKGGCVYIRSDGLPDVVADGFFDVADSDNRPLSHQEEAYVEKVAALQPEPEQTKAFPSSALRDMTDKTFANLLGMGQFVGGRE